MYLSQETQQPAKSVTIHDQNALDRLLERSDAVGLCDVHCPDELVVDFECLQAGSFYHLETTKSLKSRVEDLENWQTKENKSLEKEVTMCFAQQAPPELGKLIIREDLRKVQNKTMQDKTAVLQEWDGVVITQSSLVFLVETKHSVKYDDIRQSQRKKIRLDGYLAAGNITDSGWQHFRGSKTVLVIGGVDFPEDLRKFCKDEGIMIVSPSGGRFWLESNSGGASHLGP